MPSACRETKQLTYPKTPPSDLIPQATKKDVTDNIELLRSLNLGVVGLGSHDSSDAVITRFSETFGDRYEKVLVGSWINIAPGKSE